MKIDQVIDHAAEMQQQLDQLTYEILLADVMIVALAAIVASLAYQLWKASR